MDSITWIIISLVAIGIIIGLAITFITIRRRKGIEMTGSEYLTFFIIGVSYLALGIALSFVFPQDTDFFNFFTFMGIIFTAMGLSNIDKWRKKRD